MKDYSKHTVLVAGNKIQEDCKIWMANVLVLSNSSFKSTQQYSTGLIDYYIIEIQKFNNLFKSNTLYLQILLIHMGIYWGQFIRGIYWAQFNREIFRRQFTRGFSGRNSLGLIIQGDFQQTTHQGISQVEIHWRQFTRLILQAGIYWGS